MDAISGLPARLTAAEVGRRMGLPERRAADLIARAMRAFPMPADPDPADVVFEDEVLIATNKPPGLNTAPAHRSVVDQGGDGSQHRTGTQVGC